MPLELKQWVAIRQQTWAQLALEVDFPSQADSARKKEHFTISVIGRCLSLDERHDELTATAVCP